MTIRAIESTWNRGKISRRNLWFSCILFPFENEYDEPLQYIERFENHQEKRRKNNEWRCCCSNYLTWQSWSTKYILLDVNRIFYHQRFRIGMQTKDNLNSSNYEWKEMIDLERTRELFSFDGLNLSFQINVIIATRWHIEIIRVQLNRLFDTVVDSDTVDPLTISVEESWRWIEGMSCIFQDKGDQKKEKNNRLNRDRVEDQMNHDDNESLKQCHSLWFFCDYFMFLLYFQIPR